MRILLTGGGGFLGAWVVRRLVRRGIEPRVFDVGTDRGTVAEIAGEDVARDLDWRVGDIRATTEVVRAAEGCNGVIHLAAVLTPACKADPVRGAEINLIGTLNVFEAARQHGFPSVVYASSAGVFGPDDPRHPCPTTHYGAFKLAGEGAARAYWADVGLPSIGFRPLVVYGAGRETGSSAGPSLACRAAARGEPYVHPFTGVTGLVYVDDCAAMFEHAVLTPATGAAVYNLIGDVVAVDDVLAEIRHNVPGARLRASGPALPIAPGVSEEGLDGFFPGRPRTSLAQGVKATIDHYRGRIGASAAASRRPR
jgi:nucleoside-diphosphate-sugar epimerase